MTSSITRRVEEARKYLGEYEKVEEVSTILYWQKAKFTYLLKKENLWKFAVGESTGTWGGFCAEILKCPLTTADHRAANWEFYVEKHQFEPEILANFDAYALYYISIYHKDSDRDTVEEVMASSKVLGRKDLIMELQGREDCAHEPEEEHILVCKKCHKKLKENGKKRKG